MLAADANIDLLHCNIMEHFRVNTNKFNEIKHVKKRISSLLAADANIVLLHFGTVGKFCGKDSCL